MLSDDKMFWEAGIGQRAAQITTLLLFPEWNTFSHMNDAEILAAFHARRYHYDTYLQANDIQQYTCPGCGFPSLNERGGFNICDVCTWEDDGQDDHAEGLIAALRVEGVQISGPNGQLSLTDNRMNIGRILETNTELINGEIDFDVARVLQTLDFYRQRKVEIEGRMTGEESLQDHILLEWKEVKKDLQMALIVPKE